MHIWKGERHGKENCTSSPDDGEHDGHVHAILFAMCSPGKILCRFLVRNEPGNSLRAPCFFLEKPGKENVFHDLDFPLAAAAQFPLWANVLPAHRLKMNPES